MYSLRTILILVMITVFLFSLVLNLLLRTEPSLTDDVSQEEVSNDTTPPPPQNRDPEGSNDPVSQENESVFEPLGTDLNMEFPTIDE